MSHNGSRRRFLKSAGTVAGIGTLAGCTALGGSGDGSDEGNSIDVGDLGNGEASEEVEIDFWLSIGAEDLVQNIADGFNEQSDSITVSVSAEGNYGEVWNQTQQAQTAGDPPAVVHLNAVSTLPAWAEEVVVPAEDLIGTEIDRSSFVDAVSGYYVIDDTLLGLPFGVSSVACSYNRTAFEEAGLDAHPDDVRLDTFDDWMQAAEAVVSETDIEYGVTWPQIGWFYETYFSLLGQNFINNENGRSGPASESHYDSRAARRIYEWNKEMYEQDYYQLTEAWGDARQSFLNQQSAVQLDSSAALAALSDGASDAGFETGVGQVPAYSSDEREGKIIGGGALFVPSGIEGPALEAAAEFMLWMAQPQQQADWHMQTGYYPARPDAIEIAEEEGFYEGSPQFRRAYNQFTGRAETTATAGAFTYDHGEIRSEIVNGLDRMYGGASVDDALSSTKSNIDSVLERASEADPR